MRTEQLLQQVYDHEPTYTNIKMPLQGSESDSKASLESETVQYTSQALKAPQNGSHELTGHVLEHPSWAIDALLAYRNLLCAEDHIDELLRSPESTDEKSALIGIKHEVENLRSVIMPKEADSRYHCLTKHLATAYEALREVAKAEPLNPDWEMIKSSVGDLLYESLEKLWGTKIELCERCKGDGSLQRNDK